MRYEKLVDVIFAACAERIKNIDWMSEATKQQALKKLNTVTKKVGYPEKWRDYSDYQVDRTSYLMNCIRGNIWLSNFYIRKLSKPVDRSAMGLSLNRMRFSRKSDAWSRLAFPLKAACTSVIALT